jgi:hypothetical protein
LLFTLTKQVIIDTSYRFKYQLAINKKINIRLIGISLPHFCAVPNQDWISICICSDLFCVQWFRGEEVVSFVNIGGITQMYWLSTEVAHSVFSGIHVAQSFSIMFYRPLFVFCSLSSGHYIVCPFRFVASDYSFGMFKLFLNSDSQYIDPFVFKLSFNN